VVQANTGDTVAIPQELKQAQYDVTLYIDTFFVNKVPSFHTISEKIVYQTSQWVPNQEIQTYQKYLDVIIKIYRRAGFKIKYICANMEFELLLASMRNEYGFSPNIANAQEHVPAVERSICVVKERC
jgi:hypothetical protein